MIRRISPLVAATTILLMIPGIAVASWLATGAGSGRSKADIAPTGSAPSVSVTGRNVAVSWSAASFWDATNVDGYTVSRYPAGGGAAQTVNPSCSGTVTGLTCTEAGVPPGSWEYAITPRHGSWVGGEGPASGTAVVGSPSFSFSSSATITALPSTRAGDLTNYVTGETVEFRLGSPTGPLLTGSTTPDPIGFAGSATTSTTIPAGTADGVHDIYAVGSDGSEAPAQVTIDTTAPVVAVSTIQKSAGGTDGYLAQSGTYYVYANVTDAVSTVATVTADVSNVTPGTTSATLNSGSWTIGSTSYNYRSGLLAASSGLSEGVETYNVTATDNVGNAGTSGGFSVTIDNTVPAGSDIQTTNGGATPGKAESGDIVTYTFSEVMDPNSIVSGWDGSATTVTLRLIQAGGSDRFEVRDSSGTTVLPLGTVRLNRTDYVTATVNFTGSTMTMSGSTVQIVLGTPSGATTTAAATATMRWTTATGATDRAGNACVAANYNETGAADLDF